MKNILKIIPAVAFAFSTCIAVAQTSGTNTTKQQKNKTGNTNSKSATRVETVLGSPTRADDQMNQGNPGYPENKATSTQAGNNRAVESVNKKGTTTKGTKKKAKAATGTTGSIDMQENNRAGGLDATTNIAAKYENDMTQMVTKLQLIFDKMKYMDQKVDLMNSVMMKEKKSRHVREQLQELTAQINALDNQIDAANIATTDRQGTTGNGSMDHVTANVMPKYENEMTHMVSSMQLMQNRMQYMNQKMDLMNSVMMKDKKARDVREQLEDLNEKINAVDYQMKAVGVTTTK